MGLGTTFGRISSPCPDDGYKPCRRPAIWVFRGNRVDRRYPAQWKRAAITIAAAFGFALLVNWVMLTIFGQKSADRAEHSLIGILFLMGYVAIHAESQDNTGRAISFFVIALIPCYLGTVFPDLDIKLLGIGGHRNPLFHSSLSYFLLVLLVGRQPGVLRAVVVGFGVGLASHLWWDVIDYGDVRWLPGGAIDRLWLGVNGLLCLIAPGGRLRRVNKPVP